MHNVLCIIENERAKKNILKEKSFSFAVHIVKLCKLLADEKKNLSSAGKFFVREHL